MQKLGYFLAVGALAAVTACGGAETNNAVGENRPDAAAVNRAAGVTNTSDNREANPNTAREVTGSSGQTTGQQAERAVDNAGNAASDVALTTKVQAQFMSDNLVKARRINVDSKDGVVTLTGAVASKAESDKAEQMARETEDVKRVVNNLTVDATKR
jgi:osmotically-inducible protein OsmY